MTITATKRCTSCNVEKPIEEFSPQRMRGKVYRNSRCKQCVSNIKRERRAADPTLKHPKRPFVDTSGQLVKECWGCGEIKPVAAYAAANKLGTLKSKCKDCVALAMREQYWADPEKHREAVRRFYRQNPGRNTERKRQWSENNREKLRASYRRHYYRHRDAILAQMRTPEQARRKKAWRRAWAKTNHKNSEYRNLQRTRDASTAIVEKIDWDAIVERDRSICYLCHCVLPPDKIIMEHVTPLSRGGAHSSDNIRVACRPCNTRKGSKLLSELDWYTEE